MLYTYNQSLTARPFLHIFFLYNVVLNIQVNVSGDSLTYHNAMSFSTRDQDNDKISGICTNTYGGGGWWFNDCLRSNLNGLYRRGSGSKGVTWNKVKNRPYSMKFSRMMIRRVWYTLQYCPLHIIHLLYVTIPFHMFLYSI